MPVITIPCKSDQKPEPLVEWQRRWEAHMRRLLEGADLEQLSAPHFGYYDFFLRAHNEERVQVAQVWDQTWVVHAQCAWHGSEEHNCDYRTPPDHIHIALDVERPQTIKAAIAGPCIKALQSSVYEAVAPIVEERLGPNPRRGGRPNPRAHHIVWQNVPFSPDSDDSIVQAADLVAVYTRELLPAAEAAAIRFSVEQGFVLETCPLERSD